MMTSPQPPPKSTPKSAWSDAALAAAEVAFPGAAQPPTPDAVAQAIRSLTPARRTAVAVGVALRFRRDQPDRVRELARAMLVTPTLCSTIPIIRAVTATEEPQEKEKKPAPPAAGSGGPPTVARVSVDDDDAAEWDVVPTEEDIKLLVSQTSACKNLHHHLFALTLATVLCDEEILTKISEHPSSTLSHIAKRSLKVVRKSKSKAKKSASSHIATAPPSVASVAPVASLASVDAKKSNELDTFASFAQKVQSPPEGKTRTQIWNEEGSIIRRSWYVDNSTRATLVGNIIKLFDDFPPLDQKRRPFFPVHLKDSRTLHYMLKVDPSNTLRIYLLANTDPDRPINPVPAAPIMQNWALSRLEPELRKQAVVTLKPLFHQLGLLSECEDLRLLSAISYDVRTVMTNCSEVTDFLLDEALATLDRILRLNSESLIAANKTRRASLTAVSKRVFILLGALRDRWGQVASSGKQEMEKIIESQLSAATKTYFVLVAGLASPGSPILAEIGKKDVNNLQTELFTPAVDLCLPSQWWPVGCSSLLQPLVPFFAEHLDCFDLPKGPGIRVEMSAEQSQTYASLKAFAEKLLKAFKQPSQPRLADLVPAHRLTPEPVLIRPWSSAEVFDVILKRLHPDEGYLEFWTSAVQQGLLVDSDRLKVHDAVPDMFAKLFDGVKWSMSTLVLTVLDRIAVDAALCHRHVEKLMASANSPALTGPNNTPLMSQDFIESLKDRMDIRVPAVRTMLQTEINQPTFELRKPSYQRLLRSTFKADSKDEVLKTLPWLFHRMRNEITVDLDNIIAYLEGLWPKSLIENLNHNEAQVLAKALTTLDTNNLEAVSVCYRARNFGMNLANTCILHFMGNPSHPLFEYAINLKWRHAIFFSGTKKAASSISFPSGSPEAVTESMELRKRNSYWKGMEIGRELNALTEKDIAAIKEFAKNKASLLEEARAFFGSYAIEDGAENQTVDAVCALMESKYKALEDNSGTPFGDSACYPMLMFHLTDTLGYRWSRSQTLVKFCERSLEILKAAPLMDIPGSSERALCWTGEKEVAALKFLTRKFVCGSKAQLSSWWFNTFVDLRIKSSEAMSELTRRFSTIGTEMTRAAHRLRQNYAKQEQLVEQAMALSPGGSALYNAAVLEFVLKFRPDLIVPEHISNRKLPGLFHPEDNGVEVDFVLSSQPEFRPVNFNRLIPWQIEAFRMRFMEEALDSKVPLQRRVVAVSRMMHAWSLSVKDVAGVLLSPSLPQRLMEAILMFLPQMDEPGAAATIAVAPVFLGSELVRTAVFTIKKILATLPQGLTEDLLLSIVPKKKQYMRITAFKELVRVLISFASTSPRLLEALRELWRRENLHSDVRIAFVQNVQPYLLRESGELSTLAWDVCIDCVASPVKLLATAAILLGLEPSSDYWNSTARAELEKRAVTNILAKQDSTNVHIWNNCCDRYLFDILLPLGPQLDELLGTLPPTDKDYSQVEMWRNKAYSIINNYWVVECQSKPRLIPVLRDRLTSAMARASSYTANRGEKDRLMQTLFALISCAATESVWKHSPIPESWITVEECLASLFAAAYDPSTPFKTRLITRDILSTISLSNFYLPTEHLKSRELRDRAQKLFSSTLRSVPGVWPTLRTAQWGRDLAMFRKDLNAVTFELSQPADLIDPAISQRLDALKATADRLIEEAFVAAATGPANGSEVLSPVSCTLEVVKALATAKQADELRVRLMESDVWGRELPGFPAARNTLRLEVVKKLGTESFRSTELAIGFVQSLTAERDCAFLKSNIPDVASWFAGLFNTFREKCLMDIRNPFVRDLKEEDAPLEHLQSIRNEVVRLGKLCEGDKSDPPSAITRLVAQVVNSDPLFFLQHEPTLAMQVMQRDPFGKAFSDWFGMVNRCIKEIDKNNRKEFLQRPYYAVQSMAPLVDRIVHEARTANFETERSRFASLFVTLATTGTRFMFHLATDAVRDYILSKPESALAVAFLGQQVAATVGVEGLAALHVAMREGWAADLNWKVFGDLERTRTGPSLFRMEFEKNEQMAFVQTESSLARRAAFSGSIEAVSRAFVANFEASPLCTQKTVGKLKPLDVTSWELKVAAASSQEGDETAKKRPAVSDSVAMANPSFYFDATLEALHKTITASDLLATAHDKLVIGTAGLFDGAVVGVAASSDEAAKTATTTAKSTSTHAAAAVKKGTVAFGFPVRAIVDAAAQLAREVAPRLERRGLAFAAARARLAAVETLAQLQRATAASTFAVAPLLAPRKRRPVNAAAALVDALLAEAAVPSDPPADAVAAAAAAAAVASKAGAADAADTAAPATRWMRVEGFQELVEELAMSADDRVYKVAASIEDAAWKLRWEVEA